jgi:multicomponent K+:H+ antiporter subunit A
MRFIAVLWGMFSVAYSLRFIHGVFFGPAPAGLPRTPQEPPRWMRFPIELLVLACLVVGILPTLTIGPILDVGVRALLGANTPSYQLRGVARLHHAARDEPGGARRRGRAVCAAAEVSRARRRQGSPAFLPPTGRRIFDRVLVLVSWRWARSLDAMLGTRKLQSQLRWAMTAALLAGLWPVWQRGRNGARCPGPTSIRRSRSPWAIGAACALGAAWQAKFHRLVALVLLGGAGLVVCLTFVWFSAPDLALTQLLVEIVTTVLLLLGLRWLPKRIPFVWTLPGALAALPRRLRDPGDRGGFGRGPCRHLVCRDDPAASRQHHLALLHGARLSARRRDQRGQRHHCRLPRLRYARRNRGAGVVAISVYALLRRFPPGAGEHAAAIAAEGARCGERSRGLARARSAHAPDVPGHSPARGISAAARP